MHARYNPDHMRRSDEEKRRQKRVISYRKPDWNSCGVWDGGSLKENSFSGIDERMRTK